MGRNADTGGGAARPELGSAAEFCLLTTVIDVSKTPRSMGTLMCSAYGELVTNQFFRQISALSSSTTFIQWNHNTIAKGLYTTKQIKRTFEPPKTIYPSNHDQWVFAVCPRGI